MWFFGGKIFLVFFFSFELLIEIVEIIKPYAQTHNLMRDSMRVQVHLHFTS